MSDSVIFFLVGACIVSLGCWFAYYPLGVIAVGIFFLVIAYRASKNEGGSDE
jgi:hypothetical protein